MLCAAIIFSIAGCVRTYTFERERVDQELTGNRGVIMGRRDYRHRELKKPKKDSKKISATTILPPTTTVEVVKKKRKEE